MGWKNRASERIFDLEQSVGALRVALDQERRGEYASDLFKWRGKSSEPTLNAKMQAIMDYLGVEVAESEPSKLKVVKIKKGKK